MAVRKPSAFGITAISVIYFGALFYWKSAELFGTDRDAMISAAQMIAVAVAYVAFVLWAIQRDIPDYIKQIKFAGIRWGSAAKFMIWLSIMGVFFYWALQDSSQVGFLFVGI